MLELLNKIYILNYKPLVERHKKLEKFFNDKPYKNKIMFIDSEPLKNPKVENQKITIAEYSLMYKHALAVKDQIDNQHQYVLVMEDDVVLPMQNNIIFEDFIDRCMREWIILDSDMMICGGSKNLEVKNIEKNKYVYYRTIYNSRYSHAYIVNLRCADKIYNHFNTKTHLPVDHLINEFVLVYHLKVCWTHPYLIQSTIDLGEKSSIYERSC